MSQAHFLLVANYFVFNLCFPVGLEGTLTFVKKLLIGHTDSLKKRRKVVSLLSKLTKTVFENIYLKMLCEYLFGMHVIL